MTGREAGRPEKEETEVLTPEMVEAHWITQVWSNPEVSGLFTVELVPGVKKEICRYSAMVMRKSPQNCYSWFQGTEEPKVSKTNVYENYVLK